MNRREIGGMAPGASMGRIFLNFSDVEVVFFPVTDEARERLKVN